MNFLAPTEPSHGDAADADPSTSPMELRQREAFYHSLIESISDVILIVDRDRRIRFISRAVEGLLGIPPAEVVDRKIWDFVHPADVAGLDDRTERRIRGEGDPDRYTEARVRHRDGSWRTIQVRGRRFDLGADSPAIVIAVRDITDQRETEAALARSIDFHLSLLNRFPALVWRLDPSGNVDYVNHTWLEFTGRRLEDKRGLGWLEAVHPDDQQACLEAFQKAFYARERFEWRYRLRHVSGEYRWVFDVAQPFHDSDGDFLGYIGCAIDVTEYRQLEDQLLQAQKMEAVGRLAGGVAHDFNNLLTGIKGHTELLLQELAGPDPRREDVEEIGRAVDRAARLTRQLLVLSRRQVLQPQLLDLGHVLIDMERLLRRLIGEDIELVTDLEQMPGLIRADRSQIEQVVLNLVINARDAMPRGGRLSIETRKVALDTEHARRVGGELSPGAYVRLAVKDTGIGIDEETRRRIFEPFFTTRENGTGLGLSTVYGIVKQSGGAIVVRSEPGRGSAFEVYLPRLDAEEAASLDEAGIGERRDSAIGQGGTETILLVEDEPLVRSFAKRALERRGYHVIEAANGGEAIRASAEFRGEIHLLLSDVVLPHRSGPDIAAELLASRPGLQVIFISGYAGDTISRHGIHEKGAAFLEKPFTYDALLRTVRDTLDRARN